MIEEVVDFLSGHTGDVRNRVRDAMLVASEQQDYERAGRLRDQLKWLEQAGFVDVDVFWMQAGHALFGGRKR